MCLARVYDFLGDAEAASGHKNASLEWCRRLRDIDNHGKVRAHSTLCSGYVVVFFGRGIVMAVQASKIERTR